MEGRLRAAMASAHAEHSACLAGLVPTIAPSRALAATRDFKASEIALVPLTSAISKLKVDPRKDTSIAPNSVLIDEELVLSPRHQAEV